MTNTDNQDMRNGASALYAITELRREIKPGEDQFYCYLQLATVASADLDKPTGSTTAIGRISTSCAELQEIWLATRRAWLRKKKPSRQRLKIEVATDTPSTSEGELQSIAPTNEAPKLKFIAIVSDADTDLQMYASATIIMEDLIDAMNASRLKGCQDVFIAANGKATESEQRLIEARKQFRTMDPAPKTHDKGLETPMVSIDSMDGFLLEWAVSKMRQEERKKSDRSFLGPGDLDGVMEDAERLLGKQFSPDYLKTLQQKPGISSNLVLDVLEDDKMVPRHNPNAGIEEWFAESQQGLLREGYGVSPGVAILRCALKMRFSEDMRVPRCLVDAAQDVIVRAENDVDKTSRNPGLQSRAV